MYRPIHPHLSPLPSRERGGKQISGEPNKNLSYFPGAALGILLLALTFVACASPTPANLNQTISPPSPIDSSLPIIIPTTVPTATPAPIEKIPEPPAPTSLKITTISITNNQKKTVSIEVELAVTPEQLQTGLMNRKSLPEMRGMIFDFSLYGGSVNVPFYMKNTFIPLSIAFISGDGRIVDIKDMEPLSETLHYPSVLYHYALEVNQGWFQKHGIKVGDTVKF